MHKKLLALLFLLFAKTIAFAQYTTPGTGVNWTMADLVTNAPAAVSFSGGIYTISQNITIAATDALRIETDNTTVHVNAGVLITVSGSFITNAQNITITATPAEPQTYFQGIRFEDNSVANFKNTTITYGGGIRVLTANFTMDNCTVSYHNAGASTGGAIGFSKGSPVVTNSTFKFNNQPAFSSGATNLVSATFTNNYLEWNSNTANNRPQINMGPSGNDTIRIVGNTIKGNPLNTSIGGIAVANFTTSPNKVIIDNNIIFDNRYGITVTGATSSGYIRGNIITDNKYEPNPLMGGSGISLSASSPGMNIFVANNQIRGNLWGITLVTQGHANLGDGTDNSPGGNIFANNMNGGVTYALYNNTPQAVSAMNNCWIEGSEPTAAQVEAVITHQADIPNLGPVNYTPFGCTLGTGDLTLAKPVIYPNPTNGVLNVNIAEESTLAIYNLSGQLVRESKLTSGDNQVTLDLPTGVYILKSTVGSKNFNQKLIIN
ncbi:MAG: T9SS type A sorting domain-containing protein [Flavobacterium sp.]